MTPYYPPIIRECTPEEFPSVEKWVIGETTQREALNRALRRDVGEWTIDQVRKGIAYVTRTYPNGALDITVPHPDHTHQCFNYYGQVESPIATNNHMRAIRELLAVNAEDPRISVIQRDQILEFMETLQPSEVQIGTQFRDETCFEFKSPTVDRNPQLVHQGWYSESAIRFARNIHDICRKFD